MRTVFICSTIFLASCGLFKPKTPVPDPVKQWRAFESRSYPEFHKALYLEYENAGKTDAELGIYPLTDNGYEFFYVNQEFQGNIVISENDRKNARNYRHIFSHPDSIAGKTGSSCLWLTAINFQELQNTGKTTMRVGQHQLESADGNLQMLQDSLITFEVKGVSNYKILLQDSVFEFSVVEIVGKEIPFYMSFLPDANYPLIIQTPWAEKSLHPKYQLTVMENAPANYASFVPGPGCVLKYHMTERFVEEYDITLTNSVWTDSLLKFRLKGSYIGPEYTYDFDYDIVYKNKAVLNPDFLVPVFSAIKGEMVEDTFNWFLLRKNEFKEMRKNKSGYFSVPHFVENPDEDKAAYEDTASYNEAKREYMNSFRTWYTLVEYGRMQNTDYMFYGEDNYDEKLLPSKRFYSAEYQSEIEILDRGNYPLLLYYTGGGGEVEISLVYAGFPKE